MNGTTSRGPGLERQTVGIIHQGTHCNPPRQHSRPLFYPPLPVSFPCSVQTYIYLYLTRLLRSTMSQFLLSNSWLSMYIGCWLYPYYRRFRHSSFRFSRYVSITHVGRWVEGGPDLRNLSSRRRLYGDSREMFTRPSLCIVHRVVSGSAFPRHTMVLL